MQQMLHVIQFGIDQAERYGFTCTGPVRLYLDLMLLFGSHFDTDPQYPWAAKILTRSTIDNQMQQADLLHQKTMDYRQKVGGPDDVYTLTALRRIVVFASQPVSLVADRFMADMLNTLAQLYPQKAAYLGTAAQETLIKKAIGGAQRQGFTTVRATTLIAILMLAFGHGCGIDPLYPWIAKTLNNQAAANPDDIAKHLENKAMIWLAHVLKYFDELDAK
jgi:hypothetical protein